MVSSIVAKLLGLYPAVHLVFAAASKGLELPPWPSRWHHPTTHVFELPYVVSYLKISQTHVQ